MPSLPNRSLRLRDLLMLSVLACGQPAPTDMKYVKSVKVKGSAPTTITVSDSESEALAGTTLEIPQGALPNDTTITLALGGASLTSHGAGPVAVWGPSGTVFTKPVTMTLPYKLAGAPLSTLVIAVLEANERRTTILHPALTIDTEAAEVSFAVNSFSSFQATSQCSSDSDCGLSQACVAATCVKIDAGTAAAGGGSGEGGGSASGGGDAAGGGSAVDAGDLDAGAELDGGSAPDAG